MGIVGTVTAKGQTTIPKEVRERLGLAEGTRIEWTVDGGRATVVARQLRATDLFGMLGKPLTGKGGTLEEIDETVQAAVARHVLGEGENSHE